MAKSLYRVVLFVTAILGCANVSWGQSPLRLPSSKTVKLPNGLKIILLEQHEAPIVNFRILVQAGSVFDPNGKEGVAALTADMLVRGTTTRTAQKIAAEIDFVGGRLAFGAEHDFASGDAEFLKKDLQTGIDLVSDVLQQPVFPLTEVTKLIEQKIDEVRQLKDQASDAISLYFDAYLFGKHPYARPVDGDERSLASIRRIDALQFYNAHYGPQSTTITIAGDFASADLEPMLVKRFGAWRARTTTQAPVLDTPISVRDSRLLLIDKPDSTQTFFLIGNIGIARTNPDRVAIDLVNTFFGGRFTSMLNDALRVNSGLTYGASSDFAMQKVAGPFTISSFTQNATTVPAIDMAIDVLRRLHKEGMTDEQVRSTRNYLKGQFPTQIETSSQLALMLAELDFYGLDEREVNEYFARLDQVTRDEAQRIIKTYFPLNKLVFVLIGKAEEIRGAVRKYAPQIEERPISRPGFK